MAPIRKGNFTTAHALAFVREPGEDRLALIERDETLILVVADGAGGLSGGALAAELVVKLVREAVDIPSFELHLPESWTELLSRADAALEAEPHAGESTAVVLAVSEHGLSGASCGDSGAWVVSVETRIDDLTAHQHWKLRLGSGKAQPVSFWRPRLDGRSSWRRMACSTTLGPRRSLRWLVESASTKRPES